VNIFVEMNFLSHYHFFKKESAYYNLGLILPDLIKSFCGKHYKSDKEFVHKQMRDLKSGADLHLKTDIIFHQSEVFSKMEHFIAEQLDEEAKWPRKWFFNHLLAEILIDRIIIEKFPETCDNFYANFDRIDSSIVSTFLKINGIQNYQNFAPGMEKFVKAAFLFDYKHNENIILALARVYQRTGVKYLFTKEDGLYLAKHLDTLLYYFDLQHDTLSALWKDTLKE